jgi:hypothetical protein
VRQFAVYLGVFVLGWGLTQTIVWSLILWRMRAFQRKWRARALAGKCSPTLTAHILKRPVVWRDE